MGVRGVNALDRMVVHAIEVRRQDVGGAGMGEKSTEDVYGVRSTVSTKEVLGGPLVVVDGLSSAPAMSGSGTCGHKPQRGPGGGINSCALSPSRPCGGYTGEKLG